MATTAQSKKPKAKKAPVKKQGNLFSNIKSYLNRANITTAANVLVDLALVVVAIHLIAIYI